MSSQGSPAASLADQVIERLLTASDSVRRRLGEHVLRFGLSEPRVNLLRNLEARGPAGSSQVEVAEALGIGESSVCNLIERMRSDGLVYRFRAREDRRKSLVMLSPEGESLLRAWQADYRQQAPAWISGLSDAQCFQLLDLLDRLAECRSPSVAPELHESSSVSPAPSEQDSPASTSVPATRWKEAG